MDYKGHISIFQLLEQPFNVVHELYRLTFLKRKAQKEEEERKRLEAEQKEKLEQQSHRDAVRSNIPAFATKNEVMKQTPPQIEAKSEDPKVIEQKPMGFNNPTERSNLVGQMISSDMQDILEEVMT